MKRPWRVNGFLRMAIAVAPSWLFSISACADDDGTAAGPSAGGGTTSLGGNGDGAGSNSGGSGGTGGAPVGEGGAGAGGISEGGGGGSVRACGSSATSPNAWIEAEFADVPVLSGDFTTRQFVELPRFIRDASGTTAKYAFDLREEEAPNDPRAALVDVTVTDLMSTDEYGAAISTGYAPGATLFLSNVTLEPNWPVWESYETTNYDGMVLDGSVAIYAEDLTIRNWNADSAIDVKADTAQLVCLTTEGDGNRTLRVWRPGPHYIVASSIENEAGVILWFSDCDITTLYVYDSTFNGSPTVPADKIACDNGSNPDIVYLSTDPRTTGEMHPMFSPR